jgi:hypothetical protein
LFIYLFGGATAHMFRFLDLTHLDTQQNNKQKRRKLLASAGFETVVLEMERPQIYAFNRTATRIKLPIS